MIGSWRVKFRISFWEGLVVKFGNGFLGEISVCTKIRYRVFFSFFRLVFLGVSSFSFGLFF